MKQRSLAILAAILQWICGLKEKRTMMTSMRNSKKVFNNTDVKDSDDGFTDD